MKRRNFLALGALLGMVGAPFEALAQPKKKTASTSGKKTASSSTNKASNSKKRKSSNIPASADNAAPNKSSTKKSRSTRATVTTHPDGAQVIPTVTGPKGAEPPPVLSPTRAGDSIIPWRHYTLDFSIDIPLSGQVTRLWLPLPLVQDRPYQHHQGLTWTGNFKRAWLFRQAEENFEGLFAQWNTTGNEADRTADPNAHISLACNISTQDRQFDITKRRIQGESEETLRRALAETGVIPLNAHASALADQIIGRIKDPVARGKAIYDWIIDNMRIKPGITGPGCGSGDIKGMLSTRDYQGGSADICGLFVTLCRACGLPARLFYGLYVDESRLLKALGASGNLNNAWHCRAEFYVHGFGWIPVDPAAAVAGLGSNELFNNDSRRQLLKKVLFGFWEMNWIAFNSGEDIHPLNFAHPNLPYLVQPLVESDNKLLATADGRTSASAQPFSSKILSWRHDASLDEIPLERQVTPPVKAAPAAPVETSPPSVVKPESVPPIPASPASPVSASGTAATEKSGPSPVPPATTAPDAPGPSQTRETEKSNTAESKVEAAEPPK